MKFFTFFTIKNQETALKLGYKWDFVSGIWTEPDSNFLMLKEDKTLSHCNSYSHVTNNGYEFLTEEELLGFCCKDINNILVPIKNKEQYKTVIRMADYLNFCIRQGDYDCDYLMFDLYSNGVRPIKKGETLPFSFMTIPFEKLKIEDLTFEKRAKLSIGECVFKKGDRKQSDYIEIPEIRYLKITQQVIEFLENSLENSEGGPCEIKIGKIILNKEDIKKLVRFFYVDR